MQHTGALLAPEAQAENISRPYPFFLAYPIEGDPADQLGALDQWQVEWKWDGSIGGVARREP